MNHQSSESPHAEIHILEEYMTKEQRFMLTESCDAREELLQDAKKLQREIKNIEHEQKKSTRDHKTKSSKSLDLKIKMKSLTKRVVKLEKIQQNIDVHDEKLIGEISKEADEPDE